MVERRQLWAFEEQLQLVAWLEVEAGTLHCCNHAVIGAVHLCVLVELLLLYMTLVVGLVEVAQHGKPQEVVRV